jgi:hypothetical protein
LVDGAARRLGLWLLGACFATASWNAVYFHGLQLCDWFLLAAAMATALDVLSRPEVLRLPPPGIWVGGLLIALAGIWTAVFPASAAYLSHRYNPISNLPLLGAGGGNLEQLAKFEIALLAVPAVVLAARPALREIRSLADCLVFAGVASSFVALTDKLGYTHINARLVGAIDISGRESGLTQAPNHLAVAIVLAIPLGAALAARRRSIGWASVVMLLVGLYLSGSRGGLVAGVAALPATLLVIQRTRNSLFWVVSATLVGIAAFAPDLSRLAGSTRLSSGGAVESDLLRRQLLQQALHDWAHSPLHGIGFAEITSAHEGHLQLLAAGGLCAFVGFVVYMGSALRRMAAASHADEVLGRALAVSTVAWLALMFVENQLTNVYLYAPIGLILALAEHNQRSADAGRLTAPTRQVSVRSRAAATV